MPRTPNQIFLNQAFALLQAGLGRFIDETLKQQYGTEWTAQAWEYFDKEIPPTEAGHHVQALFKMMAHTWDEVFASLFTERTDVFVSQTLFDELFNASRDVPALPTLRTADVYRITDGVGRLLYHIRAPEAEAAETLQLNLAKQLLTEAGTYGTPASNPQPSVWEWLQKRKENRPPREPLEKRDRILFDLEQLLAPYRSLQQQSFNQIDIYIPVETEAQATVFTDYFITNHPTNLKPALLRHFSEAGLERFHNLPIRFHIVQGFSEETFNTLSETEQEKIRAQGHWIRLQKQASNTSSESLEATLHILHGVPARRRSYFHIQSTDRILNIGRMDVYRDAGGLRNNHIAFDETHPDNAEISRAHACIRFDASSNTFQIKDEGSSYGTRIQRGDRSLPIRQHYTTLQAGDEIYLGSTVHLKFELGPATS